MSLSAKTVLIMRSELPLLVNAVKTGACVRSSTLSLVVLVVVQVELLHRLLMLLDLERGIPL